MNKTRKVLAFTLALALAVVLGLSACSSGGSKQDAASGAAPGSSAAASGGIDTSSFETISYVVLGNKPTNGQLEKVMEKVNQIMKEKINAELQFKWIEWTDWLTKYNLLLASGEPLDLITVGTDWLDTWANAQKGAFLPLDDLLPKYAPETWKEIPPEDWEQTKYNNKIVMIPEDHYTQWVNHGLMYRGDWAKEFGITEPIKDFETIGKYLQGIKDHKPGVVPFDAGGTGSLFNGYVNSTTDALELSVPAGLTTMQVFFAKSYDEKYTAYSPIFDDTMINFAKLMKEWGDKGYWREDALNFKGNTSDELLAGKTGLYEHHTQTFAGMRTQMDLKQPGSELQFFPFGITRGNLISMPITHGGTSVGAHSKHPERALMAYELIRQNKEVYQLINYGIEGVQYEIKDGKRVLPEGYDQARDQFYTDFWGGRVDKFEIPDANTWSGVYDIYKEYDKIKKPYPYGRFVFDQTPVRSELAAITQVVSQYGPAISWGKAGDPVQAVEDFRSKLKAAGYDKVLAELQKQLDAYKKLVEG
jgi:putative aldouronate transport system substrate-binding protein